MPDKRILIVAVGDALPETQQDKLRPLIPSMKKTVLALAGKTYSPHFDYAVAGLGGLQTAIASYLDPPSTKPDVIFAIASEATKAARDVVRNDPRASGIPIVFTVVSEPDQEPQGDPFAPSPPRAERITGVSRGLVQSAREAVSKFTQVVNRTLHVHWIHRQGLFQGDRAHTNITNPPPLPMQHSRHYPKAPNCNGMLDAIKQNIPPNTSPTEPLAGLFLIPDDLVGCYAGEMIRCAHDPSRKIPTLVQQLEWVCRPPDDPMGPPAFAGYGVTPEWVGTKAGDYVHKIILTPDEAKRLDVLTPLDGDREFWINLQVAQDLNVPLYHPLPKWAKPCPSQGSRGAAAKAKAPRGAATKGPAKKAKKKPAAKGEGGRKRPKAKRTAKGKKASQRKRSARRAARRQRKRK